MLRRTSIPTAVLLACSSALAFSGCAQNPLAVQGQVQTLQQQQITLQQRSRELESRASTLDQDNQELQTLLAQARQEGKLAQDQLTAVRDQLSNLTSQLAQVREDKQFSDRQAESLLASTRRRAGATITPNNSLQRNLPTINIPGVEVRMDGDVVRVELPANRMFVAESASLQQTAATLIDTVGAEVARSYPQQTIGIEGHTDNDLIRGGAAGNQQTSLARANAVYQQLVARGTLQPGQLFVVGHGGNHPVVSNATPSGRVRNNRVELVVYPEKAGGR